MNFFASVLRLTQRRNEKQWKSVTAVFTGRHEPAMVRTKMGPRPAPYNAYEIVYEADGERRRGWYSFHPLSDPDPETLSGKTIRIRCRAGKPYIFEKDTSGQDE